MAKYIQNKKINTSKSNNIRDFEDISKAAWELISSIYDSGWNSLFTNNHKNSFRKKVSLKFTPKVNVEINGKRGEKDKDTNKPARVKRIPPPILAKLPKKVKEISKYFKPIKKLLTLKL